MLSGKKLRAMRILRGMSQSELSTLSGISQTAITEYEKDKRDIRVNTANRMLKALDVVTTYTIDGMEISDI